MAIEFQENFSVAAPIDKVWEFIMAPENVARCMPGAALTELLDEKKFAGNIKVKIGAITARYDGTITYAEADKAAFRVLMIPEAKEKGGGTVGGRIETRLVAVSPTETAVSCHSSVDMTGRIVQVGRGMIDGVADQIFKKFVKNVKILLEVQEPPVAVAAAAGAAAAGAAAAGVAAPQQSAPPAQPKLDDAPINIFAEVWKWLWGAITGFFKRLLGGGSK